MTTYPLCYYLVITGKDSHMEFGAQCGMSEDQIMQYVRAYGIDPPVKYVIFEYKGKELLRLIIRGLFT